MLPLAPSITIARAEEMLKGEKKTFAPLSSSLSFFSKAWEKAVLASGRGAGDAIVSADQEKGDGLLIHAITGDNRRSK